MLPMSHVTPVFSVDRVESFLYDEEVSYLPGMSDSLLRRIPSRGDGSKLMKKTLAVLALLIFAVLEVFAFQFAPVFAGIMPPLIEADTEFNMRDTGNSAFLLWGMS